MWIIEHICVLKSSVIRIPILPLIHGIVYYFSVLQNTKYEQIANLLFSVLYYLSIIDIFILTIHNNIDTKMRLITVHMPEESLHGLDELVRLQRYPNRSEAIRLAIRDLLKEELWNKKTTTTTRLNH